MPLKEYDYKPLSYSLLLFTMSPCSSSFFTVFPPCFLLYLSFLDSDELDRRLQAQRSVQILANSTHPVVMLSYITTKPGTKDYNAITRVVKV